MDKKSNMVNPIIAAVLSFFIPGLGQIIAGRFKRGIIFLVIAIIIIIFATVIFQSWIVRIIDVLFAVFAAYDAYQMARIQMRRY